MIYKYLGNLIAKITKLVISLRRKVLPSNKIFKYLKSIIWDMGIEKKVKNNLKPEIKKPLTEWLLQETLDKGEGVSIPALGIEIYKNKIKYQN